jgi:hypothetical protein
MIVKTTSKAWRVQNVFLALSIGLGGSTLAAAAQSIPGTIEAESFDTGGEGVGYHDTTRTNLGGLYRPSEGVDIIASSVPAGGLFDVAYFEAGEWLAYTLNVATGGTYAVEVRAATSADFPNVAYHVEVDGRNVTGTVTLPNTGGWGQYQWVGKRSVTIGSGKHTLKIVSERAYMAFNSLRLSAASSTPYLGSAIALPGTIEAENYDAGGEGVAYHDTTAGNAGGQYRSEAVDIIPSGDPSGGIYDIAYFEAGEWLTYSVSVAAAGNYDLEVRASTSADFPNSAYHVEIDGSNVTGSVVLPDTGGWSNYQWLGRKTVSLSAGVHALKIVSDKPYFALNSIRVSNTGTAPPSSAQQLFSSGFEGAISFVPPTDCWGTGCWQDIVGLDTVTQFSWPANVWGRGGKILMLTDPVTITPATLSNYIVNRIDTVTGHRGNQTQALFQQISQNVNGTAPMGTSPEQNEFQLLPLTENGDLYLSYWVKLQPDLVTKMNNLPDGPGISGGGTWRAFFAMKTGGQTSWGAPADNGDYRVEVYVMTYGGGQPYWTILGDNNAGGGAPAVNNWSVENRSVPVPVGQWFKFEIFWHRSAGSDGRVWMAVNGQVIADHRGANFGAWSMPINRIMAPMVYSGSTMPIYQWVDDLEVWDGFPSAGGNNPPYAPH